MTEGVRKAISENTPVTIQIGLLVVIAVGIFWAGFHYREFKSQLDSLRTASVYRWTPQMENDLVALLQKKQRSGGEVTEADIDRIHQKWVRILRLPDAEKSG